MIKHFYQFKYGLENLFPKNFRVMPALIALAIIVVSITANAQERIISGKVTLSDDSSPLPGVNIVVKGTTNGTVTDGNGEYKISVAGDGVLIFSFVGMLSQEVATQGRTVIDISMNTDATNLNEVVVTALGISQEKRSLGYSVQEVKGSDIADT